MTTPYTGDVSLRESAMVRSGANPALRMLDLPSRGDRVALRWWWGGLLTYLVLGASLVTALVIASTRDDLTTVLLTFIGLGPQPNLAVFVLVSAGIVLTLSSASRVFLEIRSMRKEEIDIEWVHKHGKPGLHLVFVDPAKRSALLGKQMEIPDEDVSVETLMDDRVRQVHRALSSAEGGSVIPNDLRGVAEVRTSRYGAFARYASSLLLLLAVLGTFAGVKTALPGLIDAVNVAAGGTSSLNALTQPLHAVAGAFGGNALALVGSIAVGLMAQGLAMGRRHLLERLELVSAEFLYGQNTVADANPINAAIVALRDTAHEMSAASGLLVGIETGLDSLGITFRDSFNTLVDRLKDIVSRQEEGLYQKTAESLARLNQRVADLAVAVEGNAKTYAGLAEGVRARSTEATSALTQMSTTNERLAQAMDGILTAGELAKSSVSDLHRAVLELQKGVASLQNGSDTVKAEATAIRELVSTLPDALRSIGSALETTEVRLRATDSAALQGWSSVADQLSTRIGDAIARAQAKEAQTPRGQRTEVRVVAREEEQRPVASERVSGNVHSVNHAPLMSRPETASDPEATKLLREIITEMRTLRTEAHALVSERRVALMRTAAVGVGSAALGGTLVYSLLRFVG